MLPTLADLPVGATIESEAYVEDSDFISSYVRMFRPSGLAIEMGSSKLLRVYGNCGSARHPLGRTSSRSVPESLQYRGFRAAG